MTSKPYRTEYNYKRWINEKDQLHRIDGPAIEYKNGSKEWHVNGELHRLDGPAVESITGYKSWYVNGNLITYEVNQWLEGNNYTYPFNAEVQLEFILRFA